MKKRFTKISLFILIALIIVACNTTKRVGEDKKLLIKNEIIVDNKKNNNENVINQLYQKPNTSILGYRLRLNLYNLAKQKADSNYHVWLDKNEKTKKSLTNLLSEKQVDRLGKSFVISGFNNFLMKTGEKPVIFDSISTKKSLKRLQSYYYNNGYFDAKTSYTKDTSTIKKIKLKYNVVLGKAFIIDTIKTSIATPVLDSLYKTREKNSFIKSKNQYKTEDLNQERIRITNEFRNNGAFLFQPNYISYNLDTIGSNKKTNVELIIKDLSYRENDTAKTAPFKLYRISKVNIYTDYSPNKNDVKIKDSVEYNNFTLYSEQKLKYRPKSITDAVFVTKGSLYSDNNSTLTTKYLSNLKVFNYPTIQYKIDPKNANSLIASIFLTPRAKYTFNPSVDFTHSNIQDFGISGNVSLAIRNVFNGAETFDVGFRGNVGASRDLANPNNNFFNISEVGIDSRLNFPRIFFPFNTDKIIPKTMLPTTTIAVGFAKQRNIGLDKQNFTSSFTYNWLPTKNTSFRFDIFNIQFVKNVNVSNYFNIYQSSFNALNSIAINTPGVNTNYFVDNKLSIEEGTNGFINAILNQNLSTNENNIKTVRSIEERKKRLTENNLIFASSLSFTKTTNKGLTDNNFYSIKTKVESAGNVLSILARASKQLQNQGGANTIFEVEFSQYIKTEFEYIKHWDLSGKKVLAVRSFSGIAIPYGNSKSVPFSRSYFSGGSNDNRAWQPYSLGPGKSGGINDFNEANLKLSFNAELRFNIFEKFNGSIFADAGNIWNIFDDVEEESFKFKGLKSLEELALGTGFGLRYDQGLFVVRLDLGFKTYNPSKEVNEKWFKELNFSKSVINIGINYPF
ncbi:BamA/TamA family outer membrane protein [Flavobacterium sp.]|uniref:translocation and assembly module lipoprotein TamL n=1 Tax=Flavobacterium sp. TaxID=239 RepID=UPI0037527C44